MAGGLEQKLVEGIRVLVVGARAPTDAEWTEHLAEATLWIPRTKGALVVTATTGPTSKQRSDLAQNADLLAQPTAVVSTSAVVRGIMTAISWLGGKPRAFAPHSIDLALDFLKVERLARPSILREVAAMQSRLHARQSTTVNRPD